MTDDLVAFLRARLAEDEATALELGGSAWTADTDISDEYNWGIVHEGHCTIARCGIEGLDDAEHRVTHIARHDPARVMREIAAKRAILDAWQMAHNTVSQPGCPDDRRIGEYDGLDESIRHIAAVYDDHPDYREEWKP